VNAVTRPDDWYQQPDDADQDWVGDWPHQPQPNGQWPAPTASGRNPSLRDLLPPTTQQHASHPPAAAKQPRKRRRKSLVALIVLAVLGVAAIPGTYYGIRYDQYKRQTEIETMLGLIEQSESVMYDWLQEQDELGTVITAECSGSEERCAALLQDPYFISGIENSAREASTSLDAIAGQFTKSNGLTILYWHKDVIRARDAYLEHNAAWVKHLDAIDGNIDELLTDGASNDDIEPTFNIACNHLRNLQESSMYPKFTSSNQRRVEKICAD